MIYVKERPALIKAVGPGTAEDLQEGEFEALISVFDTIDSYGDVVLKGAFTDTLEDWRVKDRPIPVIWSHQWQDLWAHIGYTPAPNAVESAEGLKVRGQLDLENPMAMQAYKLLKQRRIAEFSFGYDIDEAGWGMRKSADGQDIDVFELRKLTLFEVGPCLIGVNRETELLGIKGEPPNHSSGAERKAPGQGSAPLETNRVRNLLTWSRLNQLQEADNE